MHFQVEAKQVKPLPFMNLRHVLKFFLVLKPSAQLGPSCLAQCIAKPIL